MKPIALLKGESAHINAPKAELDNGKHFTLPDSLSDISRIIKFVVTKHDYLLGQLGE